MIVSMFFVSYIEEIYYRYLIQNKWKLDMCDKRFKKYLKIFGISLVIGLLNGVSFASILLIYYNSFIILGSVKISLPIVGFILGFFIFFIVNLINSWLFNKTKNILSTSVFFANIFIWFTATLIVPI